MEKIWPSQILVCYLPARATYSDSYSYHFFAFIAEPSLSFI